MSAWAPERRVFFQKKSWNHTCSLHLHIFSSSHLHIFTSSHLHIFTSSQLHILHFSHCAVPTSNFYFAVLSRSHLAWRSKRLAPGHGAWGGSKMPTLKKARSQWDGQGWGITENWWLYVGFITECTADVTGKPDAIQYFKVNPWLEAGMRWAPILGIRPNPLNALYIYIYVCPESDKFVGRVWNGHWQIAWVLVLVASTIDRSSKSSKKGISC